LENPEKSIFDEFIQSKGIFKNKEVLRPSYTPRQLPHRQNQINHLATILVSALKGETPSNTFIYGKTGTGKTAVINYLGYALESKGKSIEMGSKEDFAKLYLDGVDCDFQREVIDTINYCGFSGFFGEDIEEELKLPINFIYINCQHVDTQYRVLTHIANHFVTNWTSRLPLTGLPTDEVYNRLRQNIDQEGGVTTIVLDEIDKLIYKSGDDILYNLSRINLDLKNARANIIGISNDLRFTEFLDARVKSSLGEEELVFPPYDAEQLLDILEHRAGNAFYEGSLDPSVVSLCAALAAQEHGDARRALDLLRVSAEIAEREGAKVVDEVYVRKAVNKIELDTVGEVVSTLPTQSKLVLYGILMHEGAKTGKLTTGEVFDTYKELCRLSGMSVLTLRRITDLISELDMLGIINTRVVSFGRGGRTRVIQATVPVENVKDILTEGEPLASLQNVRIKVQATLD